MSVKTERLPQIVWPVSAALAWLASMLWVIGQIGVGGAGGGLAASALITIPVVGAFLWLDRWTSKPPPLLFSAFAWGASIAAFCSIWSQQWLQSLVDTAMGTDVGAWVRPLIITPVTEEVFKALFLIWLLVYRRRQIAGVLNSVVFAGLVGAGFSLTENSLYLGRAITDVLHTAAVDSTVIATLGVTLFMRVGMVPFFHPLMVALTGIGVGIAANARSLWGRILPVAVALLTAVALHGVWDWGGLASPDPYFLFKVYGAVLLPVFLAMVVLVLVLRHRTGRAVITTVPVLVSDGDVAPEDADRPISLRAVGDGADPFGGLLDGPRPER